MTHRVKIEKFTGQQHLYNVYQFADWYFVLITDSEQIYYCLFPLDEFDINTAIETFEEMRKDNVLQKIK